MFNWQDQTAILFSGVLDAFIRCHPRCTAGYSTVSVSRRKGWMIKRFDATARITRIMIIISAAFRREAGLGFFIVFPYIYLGDVSVIFPETELSILYPSFRPLHHDNQRVNY